MGQPQLRQAAASEEVWRLAQELQKPALVESPSALTRAPHGRGRRRSLSMPSLSTPLAAGQPTPPSSASSPSKPRCEAAPCLEPTPSPPRRRRDRHHTAGTPAEWPAGWVPRPEPTPPGEPTYSGKPKSHEGDDAEPTSPEAASAAAKSLSMPVPCRPQLRSSVFSVSAGGPRASIRPGSAAPVMADGSAGSAPAAGGLDIPAGLLDRPPKHRETMPPVPKPSTPVLEQRELDPVVEIFKYAREMAIPVDGMRIAYGLFKTHATVPRDGSLLREGYLTQKNLGPLLRDMLGSDTASWDADEEKVFIARALKFSNKVENGSLNFREFAIWYSSHCFVEDFHLDAKEQKLRKLARKLGVSANEIDVFKRHFDSFDADGSGNIDEEEFRDVLYKCGKVPKHIGLPVGRIRQMWMQADIDGSGEIDFEEFVVFCIKYFAQDGSSDANRFESWYSQGPGAPSAVRPGSGAPR